MMRATAVALLVGMAAVTAAGAQAPPISSAKPVRGFAVAFFTTGIDYTQPEIAAKLARDGEGEAIAWSAVTQTARPHLRLGPDDALVRLAPFLVAPVQVDPARVETWQHALTFVARTPLKVVAISTPPADVRALDAQFAALPALLVLRPALDDDPAPRPDNVIAIGALPRDIGAPPLTSRIADIVLAPPAATREAPGSPDQPPRTAAEAALLAAALFTCLDLSAARSPAAAKRLLIAKAQAGPAGSAPLLSACR